MGTNYTRRTFLHQLSMGASALFLTRCSALPPLAGSLFSRREDDAPINSLLPELTPRAFFGPDPQRAHPILWNTTGQQIPTTWISHEGPVIIGGGMSGLVSAYSLRDLNPLVLESDQHFGGNSQGQEWRGIPYAIGAAYIVAPESGDEIDRLLESLDLKDSMRISRSEDLYALNGAIEHGLWHGGEKLYGAAASKVQRLRESILRIAEDHPDSRYPDMPTDDRELRQYINRLDRESFQSCLERLAGGPLPEPLATTLEQYCWSSFGASATEISAASGLNFYGSEFGDIGVFAGGNSRITQALFERLVSKNGRDALRSSTVVSQIELSEKGVKIIAHPAQGAPYGIEAPCVIVACPKFVAKRIIRDLPVDQLSACHRLRYRTYLTANVLLREPPERSFYDLYLLKQNQGKAYAPRTPIETLGATDAILASWYDSRNRRESVLSLYRALPYDGARAEFYDPASYERVRSAFERQLAEELLPLLGIAQSHVIDMRITRWGHALPLAEKNLVADGIPELLSRPIKDRIFFANQDNWALPAFETAVQVGVKMAAVARQHLT